MAYVILWECMPEKVTFLASTPIPVVFSEACLHGDNNGDVATLMIDANTLSSINGTM